MKIIEFLASNKLKKFNIITFVLSFIFIIILNANTHFNFYDLYWRFDPKKVGFVMKLN